MLSLTDTGCKGNGMLPAFPKCPGSPSSPCWSVVGAGGLVGTSEALVTRLGPVEALKGMFLLLPSPPPLYYNGSEGGGRSSYPLACPVQVQALWPAPCWAQTSGGTHKSQKWPGSFPCSSANTWCHIPPNACLSNPAPGKRPHNLPCPSYLKMLLVSCLPTFIEQIMDHVLPGALGPSWSHWPGCLFYHGSPWIISMPDGHLWASTCGHTSPEVTTGKTGSLAYY